MLRVSRPRDWGTWQAGPRVGLHFEHQTVERWAGPAGRCHAVGGSWLPTRALCDGHGRNGCSVRALAIMFARGSLQARVHANGSGVAAGPWRVLHLLHQGRGGKVAWAARQVAVAQLFGQADAGPLLLSKPKRLWPAPLTSSVRAQDESLIRQTWR